MISRLCPEEHPKQKRRTRHRAFFSPCTFRRTLWCCACCVFFPWPGFIWIRSLGFMREAGAIFSPSARAISGAFYIHATGLFSCAGTSNAPRPSMCWKHRTGVYSCACNPASITGFVWHWENLQSNVPNGRNSKGCRAIQACQQDGKSVV